MNKSFDRPTFILLLSNLGINVAICPPFFASVKSMFYVYD